MPAGKGALRIAIEDFLETSPVGKFLIGNWKTIVARRDAVIPMVEAAAKNSGPFLVLGAPLRALSAALYIATGDTTWTTGLVKEATVAPIDQAIDDWSDFWMKTATNTERQKTFEAIGAFFAEPVLSAIGGLQKGPGEDPEGYLRRVYGVLTSIVLAPSIAATAAEVVGLGQIETVAAALQSVTASLGLGSVGGILANAFLNSGVIPELQRSLQRRLRPSRFSESESRDLYAINQIGRPELVQELQEHGWRDPDIDKWIKLAFRHIGEGDLWALWKLGKITEPELITRLRATGYDPDDIPLLFLINQRQDVDEAVTLGIRILRDGYKKGVIGRDEYIDVLQKQSYSARDIALLLAIDDKNKELDARGLSLDQVKDAWANNLIGDAEAVAYLKDHFFGDREIEIILAEWKDQTQPKFAKLNRGTITSAYVAGILIRNEAQRKLEAIGLSPADAKLELDLAEIRNRDAFQTPTPTPPRTLDYSTLTRLLTVNLITADQLKARLIESNYTEADAELLKQNAVLAAEKEPKPLTKSDVEAAYIQAVIDRPTAKQFLLEMGFPEDEAEIILTTVEKENPAVFAPETLQGIRIPSTGALVAALQNEIINEATYYAKMAELGYDLNAAKMYAAIAQSNARKSVKALTQSQVLNLYDKSLMGYADALQRLVAQGLDEKDAQLLMRLYKSGIEQTDVWQAALAGAIPWNLAVQQLLGMGFTQQELVDAVSKLPEEVLSGITI